MSLILASLLLPGMVSESPNSLSRKINFTPIEIVCDARLFEPVLILLLKDFNLEVLIHLILGHYCFSIGPIGLYLRSQHPSF